MADQIPTYQRQDSIQPGSSIPDFGSAFNSYGQSAYGSLSAIGAQVAQSASTERAKEMGYQMGQTPRGDLLPPITDFDKQVSESYNAQASATLGMQANKMMMDADTEMAQANRLTPGLIAKTNQQMAQGMSSILQNAPGPIKTQLGANFANQLQNQTHNYQLKMIGQQKEDATNTMLAALRENADTAFQLASTGNVDGANKVVEQSKQIADSGVANRYFSPEQAYVSHKSIQDAAVNGKFINQALNAKADNNLEAWEKKFADADPKTLGITIAQKQAAGNAVTAYMGTLNTLRSQDENLRAAKFQTAIATDVGGITGSMMQELKDNVSPLKYEEMKLKYIDALKAANRAGSSVAEVTAQWSSPDVFARTSEKTKNAAFDNLVNYTMQKSQSSPVPITKDDAEIQVASSAGGSIPAFVAGLNNKAASANPAYIEAAARQVHELREMGAGHAIAGMSQQADALLTKYDALRAGTDPVTAARQATDIVYNQTPEQQQANKQSWSNYLTTNTKGGVVPSEFALKQVGGFRKSDFVSASMAHVYGTDMLETYNSYFQMLNGDTVSALKNAKRIVQENYGETGVNGKNYVTLHPLEKTLGYTDPGVAPFIQQDIGNQLNKNFLANKEQFAQNKINEYWEVLPSQHKDQAYIFGHDYQPVQVQRSIKVGNQTKKEKFDVVVQGNAYNQYDVSVKSDSGMRPLFQVAPYLGVVTYTPDKKAIDAAYLAAHPIK